MESFSKTLKVERIHRRRYPTRSLARLDIVAWIEGFYNHRRLHSSVGYKNRSPPSRSLWLHKLVYVKSRQGQVSSSRHFDEPVAGEAVTEILASRPGADPQWHSN